MVVRKRRSGRSKLSELRTVEGTPKSTRSLPLSVGGWHRGSRAAVFRPLGPGLAGAGRPPQKLHRVVHPARDRSSGTARELENRRVFGNRCTTTKVMAQRRRSGLSSSLRYLLWEQPDSGGGPEMSSVYSLESPASYYIPLLVRAGRGSCVLGAGSLNFGGGANHAPPNRLWYAHGPARPRPKQLFISFIPGLYD